MNLALRYPSSESDNGCRSQKNRNRREAVLCFKEAVGILFKKFLQFVQLFSPVLFHFLRYLRIGKFTVVHAYLHFFPLGFNQDIYTGYPIHPGDSLTMVWGSFTDGDSRISHPFYPDTFLSPGIKCYFFIYGINFTLADLIPVRPLVKQAFAA